MQWQVDRDFSSGSGGTTYIIRIYWISYVREVLMDLTILKFDIGKIK